MSNNYAARAQALVGTPFRAQGRDASGLDCVGVVLSSFGITPDDVRRNYGLRGDHRAELEQRLNMHFRQVPRDQLRVGDVMLLKAGDAQFHLAVRTDWGFVHAHAGIRRVVETPGTPEWPLLGVYRKRRSR